MQFCWQGLFFLKYRLYAVTSYWHSENILLTLLISEWRSDTFAISYAVDSVYLYLQFGNVAVHWEYLAHQMLFLDDEHANYFILVLFSFCKRLLARWNWSDHCCHGTTEMTNQLCPSSQNFSTNVSGLVSLCFITCCASNTKSSTNWVMNVQTVCERSALE